MVVSDSQKVDENNYEVPYDLLRPQRTNSYRCAVSHDVTQASIPAEPSWLKRSVKKLKSVFKRLRGDTCEHSKKSPIQSVTSVWHVDSSDATHP